MRSQVARLRCAYRIVAVLIAVTTAGLLTAGVADASAGSPVLEFVAPGNAFPVSFTVESGALKAELAGFESVVRCTASQGTGEITGPHSTMSQYTFTGCAAKGSSLNAKCNSEGAKEEEIVSEEVEAEPVFINQARHEVGMLLDPHGGVYMKFTCGGEPVEAIGPFLAPGSPINEETTSFTLALSESHGVQTPDEYESANGEEQMALPTGKRGTHEPAPTGVEAMFTVHTSAPIEVRAVTSADLEARQREEAERARQAENKTLEATILKLREETAADKRREESLSAKLAALEKLQKEKAKPKAPSRAQLLARALEQCKRQPARKRAHCKATAERRYGDRAGRGKGRDKRDRSRALLYTRATS